MVNNINVLPLTCVVVLVELSMTDSVEIVTGIGTMMSLGCSEAG